MLKAEAKDLTEPRFLKVNATHVLNSGRLKFAAEVSSEESTGVKLTNLASSKKGKVQFKLEMGGRGGWAAPFRKMPPVDSHKVNPRPITAPPIAPFMNADGKHKTCV